jgi:hypothetical protein
VWHGDGRDDEGSHTASSRWGRGDTEIFSKMESRSGRTSIRFRTGNFYYRNTDCTVLISFYTLWSTA